MIDTTQLPTTNDYAAAFDALRARLTPKQVRMLAFHRDIERPVTATELAARAGFASYRAVNAQYGRIGAMLREALPSLRPLPGVRSHAFASFHQITRADGGYAEWEWTLHPQVRAALSRLTWVAR
jgi:hypothetical protein